jgi:hypothetical protein
LPTLGCERSSKQTTSPAIGHPGCRDFQALTLAAFYFHLYLDVARPCSSRWAIAVIGMLCISIMLSLIATRTVYYLILLLRTKPGLQKLAPHGRGGHARRVVLADRSCALFLEPF